MFAATLLLLCHLEFRSNKSVLLAQTAKWQKRHVSFIDIAYVLSNDKQLSAEEIFHKTPCRVLRSVGNAGCLLPLT